MEKMRNLYGDDKAEQESEVVRAILGNKYPDQNGVYAKEQYDDLDKQLSLEQIDLIKKLSSVEIPTYLVGGYASDLLIGEPGQLPLNPHTDIDMVVKRGDSPVLRRKVEELGYKVKERAEVGDMPVKMYIIKSKSIQADFAIFDIDESSGKPFTITMINGKPNKASFCENMMGDTEVVLDGSKVRVVSPRGLLQSLLFYEQIGLSELREKDRIRAELLCQKFFPGETLDSPLFKVDLEEIK